ncbi:MAG: bifunctional metallophosphatase/5'-nucleotidase [Tetrasphaera sp.]
MRRKYTAAAGVGAVAALTAALSTTPAATAESGETDRPIRVQMLSFNDYHGHMEATDPPLASDPAHTPVGGVEYLSAKLNQLRTKVPASNSVTVAAGDLIGGSTFLSGMFHDEPSVESLNTLGLDVSSVGNHEFDEGTRELRRMQYGGCHPVDGCYFPSQPYAGADYQYLAANVLRKVDSKPFLPATTVRTVGGVKIGFIGITLRATPTLVDPAGVKSVNFKDEVWAANNAAIKLARAGVKAVVLLIHEGGYQTGDYTSCTDASGPILDIASRVNPAIDAVVSGHTHQPYVCTITDPLGRPRLLTSAASYGQLVTETYFSVSSTTKDVIRSSFTSQNVLVDRTTADPAETQVLDKWRALAGPLAGRVVGTVAQDVTGDSSGNRGIETPMADLMADVIKWGTQSGGSQIAFMNVGGVRASFLVNQISNGEQPGEITYTEAYNTSPFGNLLVTLDLTGAQIKTVLEQQYQPVPDRGSRPMLALGVSDGFTYTWDASQPQGSRVVPGSMKLNGTPIDMGTKYRIGTLNFLANGGDLFTEFKNGTNLLGGKEDLANLVDYLGTHPGLTPPPDRVGGL